MITWVLTGKVLRLPQIARVQREVGILCRSMSNAEGITQECTQTHLLAKLLLELENLLEIGSIQVDVLKVSFKHKLVSL